MADSPGAGRSSGLPVCVVLMLAVAAVVLAGCSATHTDPPGASAQTGHGAAAQHGAGRSGADDRGGAATSGVADDMAQGRVLTERIPGGRTGFRPRPALIYLPPAAAQHPRLRLPVLLLLGGTPSNPGDWIEHGQAASVLDRFADAHGGLAPIVVMPDINGARRADSECVRAPNGANVETYLNTVVPHFILTHLPATADRARWAIAGLSEGGTCSLVLALRAYPSFRVFGDFSGLKRLTVGPRDDPSDTITELFDGSRRAYDQHDPAYLMARHRYSALAGWFECGRSDGVVLSDQASVVAAARRAGIDVHASVIEGGHQWSVWTAALTQMLPWLWTRVGR